MPASPWSAAVRANVALAPGEQKDAFGRLRTSQPTELFSKALEYDAQPLFYENFLVAGALASYNANTVSVDLSVLAPGDVAIRQSRQYVRYRPGKSQQIFVTGNFGGQQTGVIKRMGLYDDSTQPGSTGDGLFFEVSDAGIFAVRRTSTSGISTDNQVPQASWNVDRMDGTGPSGVTLDFTKFQVCFFEFGWLGAAVIRWGFVVDGILRIVHEEFPSNSLVVPFMRHPSLPVRWEIIGYAGVTTGSLSATCASVQSEGGFNTLGVQRSVSRSGTARATAATTLVPLLSIRLRAGYERTHFVPETFSVLAAGASPANFEVLILVNPTLTAASFTSPGTAGGGPCSETVEFDTDATGISAIGSALVREYGTGGGGPSKAGAFAAGIASDVPLTSSYNGTRDILTLAVRPLSTAATDFYGSLVWREFY
jgi:hypothetical protein